ncbi:apomucin-like [Procambarus clarkii]|uniref:apomucin-like n=1 Tax=Procambarus clarkii TaxID=6728 RepID=UPI0037425331
MELPHPESPAPLRRSVTEQSAPSDPTASDSGNTVPKSPTDILRGGSRTEGTITGAPASTGTPPDDRRDTELRTSFGKVTTRPRPTPSSPPSLTAEATTPHRGEAPGGEETSGTPETQAPTSAGTWTSATTNCGASDASGTTPSTPEDPQSLNSPTSAQADDERRERLGTGLRSSEPEADFVLRSSVAHRRTAAASTTGGTGPHTSRASTAIPAPSTAGTRGEDAGPGAAAEVGGAHSDASQGATGRSTGATATGAGVASDGTATSGGGSMTTGGTLKKLSGSTSSKLFSILSFDEIRLVMPGLQS